MHHKNNECVSGSTAVSFFLFSEYLSSHQQIAVPRSMVIRQLLSIFAGPSRGQVQGPAVGSTSSAWTNKTSWHPTSVSPSLRCIRMRSSERRQFLDLVRKDPGQAMRAAIPTIILSNSTATTSGYHLQERFVVPISKEKMKNFWSGCKTTASSKRHMFLNAMILHFL